MEPPQKDRKTTAWDDDLDALLNELAEWDIGAMLAGLDADIDALLADLANYEPLPKWDIDLDSLVADWDIGDLAGWDDVDLDALLDNTGLDAMLRPG